MAWHVVFAWDPSRRPPEPHTEIVREANVIEAGVGGPLRFDADRHEVSCRMAREGATFSDFGASLARHNDMSAETFFELNPVWVLYLEDAVPAHVEYGCNFGETTSPEE